MSGDLLELLFVAAFILFGLLGSRKKRPEPPTPRPQRRPEAPRGGPPVVRRPPTPRSGTGAPATDQERLLRELEGLFTGRPVRSEPAPVPVPPSMRDMPDPDEARSLESLEDEGSARWEEGLERATEAGVSARWIAGRDQGAESLETLEEAGGASHKRFHELYDRPPTPATTPARPAFRTADLRRAMVWSEILGPPVSER